MEKGKLIRFFSQRSLRIIYSLPEQSKISIAMFLQHLVDDKFSFDNIITYIVDLFENTFFCRLYFHHFINLSHKC